MLISDVRFFIFALTFYSIIQFQHSITFLFLDYFLECYKTFYTSLKIKSISLEINVVHLFEGGTFGPGPHTKWKFLIFFYILRGPAQKVSPQNKLTKFCLNSYKNDYNTQRNKKVIECWSCVIEYKVPKWLKKQTWFGSKSKYLIMLWHIVN